MQWRRWRYRARGADSQQFAASNSRYRGGLQVSEVRPDSPAVASGIRPGDVLVGLHEWETIKPQDIRFILTHQQVASNEQVRFFLIRGQEVLQGNLKVVSALRVADTPKPVVK
jgi:serine protease Do